MVRPMRIWSAGGQPAFQVLFGHLYKRIECWVWRPFGVVRPIGRVRQLFAGHRIRLQVVLLMTVCEHGYAFPLGQLQIAMHIKNGSLRSSPNRKFSQKWSDINWLLEFNIILAFFFYLSSGTFFFVLPKGRNSCYSTCTCGCESDLGKIVQTTPWPVLHACPVRTRAQLLNMLLC